MWWMAAWLACAGGSDTDPVIPPDTDASGVDADHDGYPAGTDCDDDNNQVHPDATEVCDFVDNDCDKLVDGNDPDLPMQGYRDADHDGYAGTESRTCGDTAPKTDCDDTDATIHPDAKEGECDGIDQDCSDNGSEVALFNGTHYPNLRQAVWDAKDFGENPIVYACSGLHLENDVIYDGEGVTIEGYTKDADDVVFDGQGGTGILSATGHVTLRWVTLKSGGNNGRVPACLHAVNGGVDVEHVKFDGCATAIEAAEGGNFEPIHLTDVVITGGDQGDVPAALALATSGGEVVLDGVTVTGANSGVAPVSITASGGGDVTIRNSTFSSNTSGSDGGAVEIEVAGRASVTVDGSTFLDNTATESGGGLQVAIGQKVTPELIYVTNTRFEGNEAASGGGLIVSLDRRVGDVSVKLDTVTFASNTASQRAGGFGLYSWNGTLEDDKTALTVTMSSVAFTGNSATQDGAAVGIGVGPGALTAYDLVLEDHDGGRNVFLVDDGPYDLRFTGGHATGNSTGTGGVFDLSLVAEENTAVFTGFDFGTGAKLNTGPDLVDCATKTNGGVFSATLSAGAPCP